MNEQQDHQLSHARQLEGPGLSEGEELSSLNGQESAENAPALLLAQLIYDRTAQNFVTPLKWLKQQPLEGVEQDQLALMLEGIANEVPLPELKDITLIKGKKDSYYYDASIMTPEFARVQSLIEDKDMLATIAEVTRRDCALYPRPAPFSKFAGYPFYFSMDELEGAAARMQLSQEYQDIRIVSASNGAKAFYSSRSLSQNYARALYEDIEVDSREWQ